LSKTTLPGLFFDLIKALRESGILLFSPVSGNFITNSLILKNFSKPITQEDRYD